MILFMIEVESLVILCSSSQPSARNPRTRDFFLMYISIYVWSQ